MSNKHQYHTINKALDLAKERGIIVSKVTMINWIKKNQLGTQPGGKFSEWYIRKNEFHLFLNKMEKEKTINV